MDAQQFLAEFGHIANAPRGIVQLRKLVLDLAIRGKLLSSTHSTDATLLLSEIAALRNELVKTGKLRRHTPQPSIGGDEIAFPIPDGWAFERLGNVCEIVRGVTFPASKKLTSPAGGAVACLRTTNIQSALDWSNLIYIDPEFVSRSDQWVEVGDTMISMANSYELVGKVALVKDVPQRATFGGFIAAVRPHVLEPEYLYLVLSSPYMQAKMRATSSQTTNIANISLGGMRPIPTPIPPKEEQSRIVAKVDELMALCDRLEKQQQDRRKLQNALRQSTLQALASAESPHELQESWQRLQANFSRLFSEPGDARSLRDVLFDLALRGLLLPDSRLSAGGTPSSEELGSLPSGWKWKTLAELAEYITSGSRGWKAYMSSSGDSFIRSQDIRQDALIFESPAYVTLPERVEGKRTLVRPGDLLLTITGGNVGRCAVVPALPNKAYVSQHVALIRLQDPSLSEFIHFWMVNAFGGRAFLGRYIYGDKPGLNLTQVGSVLIPVPPASDLPEVLKSLRHYQQLCDELETQLRGAQEVASKLSNAAVAALTGVTVEKEKEVAVKAPQTELISPLRLGTLPDIKDQAPLATLLARHHGEMSARDLWQRFGGEIDAFYAQLKTEVAHGWIEDPSYELGEKEPRGPRTYPDGALVAKMKIKQES